MGWCLHMHIRTRVLQLDSADAIAIRTPHGALIVISDRLSHSAEPLAMALADEILRQQPGHVTTVPLDAWSNLPGAGHGCRRQAVVVPMLATPGIECNQWAAAATVIWGCAVARKQV
jgi:hypothetical protein